MKVTAKGNCNVKQKYYRGSNDLVCFLTKILMSELPFCNRILIALSINP